MKTVADLVKGWLAKGDSDLAEAARCAGSTGPYDTGCFHCQQAVEKFIKAVFCLHGQPAPNTHDLGRLSGMVAAIEPSLMLARTEILALTDYAGRLRYDSDFWPEQSELAESLSVARQVRMEIFAVVPTSMHPASQHP